MTPLDPAIPNASIGSLPSSLRRCLMMRTMERTKTRWRWVLRMHSMRTSVSSLRQEQLALLQDRLEKKRAKKTNAAVKREMSPIRVPMASDDEVIDLTRSP